MQLMSGCASLTAGQAASTKPRSKTHTHTHSWAGCLRACFSQFSGDQALGSIANLRKSNHICDVLPQRVPRSKHKAHSCCLVARLPASQAALVGVHSNSHSWAGRLPRRPLQISLSFKRQQRRCNRVGHVLPQRAAQQAREAPSNVPTRTRTVRPIDCGCLPRRPRQVMQY